MDRGENTRRGSSRGGWGGVRSVWCRGGVHYRRRGGRGRGPEAFHRRSGEHQILQGQRATLHETSSPLLSLLSPFLSFLFLLFSCFSRRRQVVQELVYCVRERAWRVGVYQGPQRSPHHEGRSDGRTPCQVPLVGDVRQAGLQAPLWHSAEGRWHEARHSKGREQ